MADVSLDEVIRRRSFSARGVSKRPVYGRGAGSVGRAFDARQKIGTGDVRQRLGVGGATGAFQVKDAREKLGQKDARFRIRGRGGAAGAVQDARQTINSRKQQKTPLTTAQSPPVKPTTAGIPHIHIHNTGPIGTATRNFPTNQVLNSRMGVALQPGGGITKVVDARDRLSLKRSVPSTSIQSAAPLKITKTIQRPVGMTSGIRINVPSDATQDVSDDDDDDDDDGVMPNKQMITTAHSLQTRAGSVSLSAPFTKVVKNDSYTPPSVPVPPSRPPARPPTQTLQPVSRATAATQQMDGDASVQSAAPQSPSLSQPVFSPLEGTKITVNNLHPRVSEEDIMELFCVCGALKRARLVKVGVAEVVFVRKEDAVSAYRKYNNRCLDGQPMKCNLHIQGNIITSEQPILLRLSDTPGATGSVQKNTSGSFRSGSRTSSTAEVDPQTILKALFKSSNQQPSTSASETPGATAFRIKI
ncbi:polymerase delta-interacting protein 3-like isoform X2 [Myxocyprinus asiaticus]|uniref:polymerase delta-interacting protein 3-like isoform X2 n=1 Tax=Myxocyprinus asiaticus TaxID=70543 RepID=UPI002221C868|nr:polymerase delta-interacting protein 3-like isoform X2 [Myxocyprinus asiaticus]